MQLLHNRYLEELNTIKQTFLLDTKKCCTSMFQLWLSRSTSARWEDFIIALQRSELPKVAIEVSKFYYGMNVLTYVHCSSKYYIHLFGEIATMYIITVPSNLTGYVYSSFVHECYILILQ